MNKGIIISIILIFIVVILGVVCYFQFTNKNDTSTTKQNTENVAKQEGENKENLTNENNNQNDSTKVAVIYFSATGNTEKIAKYISEETQAELIEIEPKQEYTSSDLDYRDDCRANKEQQDKNARPEIKNFINVDKYDTIFLGYPIWWGTMPKIILTFLDNYDLSGKTVIPFCTSGGSGISQSETDLRTYNKNINWVNGKGFNGSSSQNTVASWVKELNY